MSNNNDKERIEEEELDKSIVEIVKNAENKVKLTKAQLERLVNDSKESVEFLKKLDEISLKFTTYVVFTDGDEQLVYDNGEFYIENTMDSTVPRKKKRKDEARQMCINFFMKYRVTQVEREQILKETEITRENAVPTRVNTKSERQKTSDDMVR